MTLTVDTTIGGASANAYASIAFIDLYAQSMRASDAAAWAALDDADDKPAFIVRAARLLDTIPFPGSLVTMTQAMQWPRFGVEVPLATGDYGYYGAYYLPTEIPACVTKAHAQLSVYLAAQTSETFGTSDAGALAALKVGPINLTFRADSSSAPTVGRDYLEREIYPLLRAGNCAGSARSVRLTR